MRVVLILIILLILFALSGCATTSNKATSSDTSKLLVTEPNGDDFEDGFSDEEFDIKKVNDPLRGYNRFMTKFNDKFFIYLLDPVARAYKAVVHEEIRSSIGNFSHNLIFSIRVVNNLLQLKFKNALEETARFSINSTIGLLGLFDPAKKYFNLEPHEEDFGQTLGHYGLGSGFHIVLPFLGPSNLRDMLSLFPDSYISPFYYFSERCYNLLPNSYASSLSVMADQVNKESLQTGEYETIKKDAVDLYPYLRDIYEQYRDRLIKE
ncbi:MAG: VacJ family lipoprotein [Desulfobacterales bacterium]|nr:VacJ family lipoprotein [Desulfobacterales bacterium]